MKKIKIYNITLTAILLLLVITIIYLKVTITAYHKGRQKIHFAVTATDSIPALLVEAKLITGDGEILEIFKKDEPELISHYGSDEGAEGYVRMPEHLLITWFSYKNNTFYRGNFTLPKNKIEALIKNRTAFYKDMPVDIDIIIRNDNTVEVTVDFNKQAGLYKATPVNYTWPWKQDRQAEVDATLANDLIEPVFIKKSNSAYTTLDIQLYKNGYFSINSYNPNKKLLQLVDNRINDTLPAGLPEYITIGTTMDSTATHRHEVFIHFDMNEIIQAYNTLKQPRNKFELLINLSVKDSLTGIRLSNKGKSLMLNNYKTDYSY